MSKPPIPQGDLSGTTWFWAEIKENSSLIHVEIPPLTESRRRCPIFSNYRYPGPFPSKVWETSFLGVDLGTRFPARYHLSLDTFLVVSVYPWYYMVKASDCTFYSKQVEEMVQLSLF